MMRDRRAAPPALWLIGLAVAFAIVGVGVWNAAKARPASSASGAPLGRLPAGVRMSDLNVLIVTLDTTRADAMGAYGNRSAATPVFDRLGREGVLFDQAITAAPLTLPAHSSIFTAKYPPGHGVRDNGGFFLGAAETTLAERLKASGFRTGGFVGAYVLDRRWGIAQGFDTYVDEFDVARATGSASATVERPGNEVADRALAWLETAAAGRFFAWVHFYDAHSPYDPPEPYRSRFLDRPYAGEIAFADAQVGRLVEFLERRHLLSRTVVVVVGDHGESLGEHDESTHGFFVYRSVLRVPLVIRTPFDALQGTRFAATVRTVDVAPTILDLIGLPPPERVDGVSLVPLMTGAARDPGLDAYSEAMYPRYHFGWSDLRALTSGRYRFIDAPRPELYDLEQDPAEAHNLYEARRPLADRMAQSLRQLTRAGGAPTRTAEVDPDVRARLAALGYVGTFVAEPSAGGASPLPDPKDKIDLFNLMTEAREKLQDGADVPAGMEMLQRVTKKDPQVIDAWLLLGNEHANRREYDAALANYRRALELKPDYDLALRNMANVYRDLGQIDAAIAGFERLLGFDPNNGHARQELAQILLDANRVDAADRELRAALRQDPAMAAARNTLGALRLKQGQVDAAETEIRAALAQRADLPLAHFNLALAAEQRGRLDDAIAEYRQEIDRHPGSYKAQFNLGKVYERLGDRAAQQRAFEDAIASNPRFAEGHFFLAKLYLDERSYERAMALAKQGLAMQPAGEWSPLGHFVLSDAYAALGRRDDAAREAAEGRRLAARAKAGS
jgi:arylsulfatase A-like enzyme/predicted Zn-dependent protease